MTNQQSQYPDEDLDRTDQLPILQGTLPEDDIEDDAVRMDHTAVLPGSASFAAACDRLRTLLERGFAVARGECALGGGAHRAAKRRI